MPADVTGKLIQATELIESGRAEEARRVLQRVVAAAPDDPRALDLMRLALSRLGLAPQALYYAERGAPLAPDHAGMQADYGVLLSRAGKVKEAEEVLRRALGLDRGLAKAHQALVALLLFTGRYGEAEGAAREALGIFPNDDLMEMKLGAIEMETLRVREAFERLVRLRRGQPGGLAAHPEMAEYQATLANYAGLYPEESGEPLTPGRIFAMHREAGQIIAGSRAGREKQLGASGRVGKRAPQGRVRVAVVSSDLRQHPVGFFFEPVLRHADRARVELVGVMLGVPDGTAARLRRGFDRWIDASKLDERGLEDALHALEADVIVELAGLTLSHVLPVLSTRPAPVQMSYLGYPNTTGCTFMDARLVDGFTDPPGGLSEALSTERLARMDPCFLCYTPPPAADAPEAKARPETGPDGEGVVLCCYNRLQKVSRQTLAMWAEVLRRLPRARLALKDSCLVDEGARGVIRRELARWGVDEARVDLRAIVQPHREHLESFNGAHIALDAYPYHGTMTTCEALWMGTPVVTLAGPTHVARVGVSILTNAGAPELVAGTAEEYVEIAVGLAKDPGRMKAYHAGLRGRMAAGALCDGEGFAKRWVGAVCGVAKV